MLSFALPLAWSALGFIPFLNDAADWLDTTRTTEPLTEHAATAHEWAQFGTSMGSGWCCRWRSACGASRGEIRSS